jgi:hypothetical protein
MKRKGSAKKKSRWKIELQKRTDTGIIQTFSKTRILLSADLRNRHSFSP